MRMLHLFAATGSIAQMLSGAATEPPDFRAPLQFVLQRIVNPESALIGESGTHNLVHYGCINAGRALQGFLAAGQECDGIGVEVPVDRDNHAILFSVGKRRFELLQAESGSRDLVIKERGRSGVDVSEERVLLVEGLLDPAYGKHEIILKVCHGGIFKCKSAQAGIHKRLELLPSPSLVHQPSGRCPCFECVKQPGSSSMIALPMSPSYLLSSSSSSSAPSAPYSDSFHHHHQ